MKKIFCLFAMLFVLLGFASCTINDKVDDGGETGDKDKFTVVFYVDDARFKTLKVEDGSVIGEVEEPTKDGYTFTEWHDASGSVVDPATFTVSANLNLYAQFTKNEEHADLVVDATKEEGKSYYLVVGWWETTDVDADGNPKYTSYLTPSTVRLFYANLLLYLKAFGATDEQLANIQFRDYSTAKVAEMGEKINADGDVDLMIGVGNNINSTAGVSLLDSSNDNKVGGIKMGTKPEERYVALLRDNAAAISAFDWIKTTTVGAESFTKALKASDITVVPERQKELNITVTIHGDEDAETVVTSEDQALTLPAITVPEGKRLLGLATASDATEAEVVLGETLSYKAVKSLVALGATTLDLYPVFADEVITTVDLVVYIHTSNATKTFITDAEVELLKLRFAKANADLEVEYEIVKGIDAAAFNTKVHDDVAAGKNIDVIVGGNTITSSETYPATALEGYGNTNAGAKHFANTSRKTLVLATAENTEAAESFFNFLTGEAETYTFTFAFWRVGTWVTEEERDAMKTGIEAQIIADLGATALSDYAVELKFDECVETKVAGLTTETRALNDGAGVDLIIGSGKNASDEANMGADIVDQKSVSTDFMAASRYVALCHDNLFTRSVYENYFVTE